MKKSKGLPVVFRVCKIDNEVMAFFPTIPWSHMLITCYAHIGQHDGACVDYYINQTKPATKEQYEPLLNELTNLVGYENLRPMKKWMHHYAD